MPEAPDRDAPDERETINSTLRLSKFLSVLAARSDNRLFGDVLASAIPITDANQDRAVCKAVSALHRIQENAIREVEHYLSDEKDFYLPGLLAVYSVLSPKFIGTPWPNVKTGLTLAIQVQVSYTGQRLLRLVPELLLSLEELKQIMNGIADLDDAIASVNIPEHTREKFRERLTALRSAVENYSLYGSEELDRCFDSVIGSIAPSIETIERTSPEQGLAIRSAAAKIATYLGLANTTYTAAKNFWPLLEAGAKHVGQMLK